MSIKRVFYLEGNTDNTIGGSYFSLLFLVANVNHQKYEPVVGFYHSHQLLTEYEKKGVKTHIFSAPTPFVFANKKYPIFLKPYGALLSFLQKSLNFFALFVIPTIKYTLFLRKFDINLVHLNNSITRNHEWMMASRISGVKCITHERGINSSYSKSSLSLGKKLDAVICISKAVRMSILQSDSGFKNLHIIPNGLNPDDITVQKSRTELLKKYALTENAPIIGIVGNIKEWKGQETVINAVAILQANYPTLKCFIVGDVSKECQYYYEKLKKIILTSKIESNIVFTGYQKNPADFLNIMDIVIHSSIEPEPFGRVILEAMALKKPVIGTNAGGVPEIIRHRETGLLIAPGNPDVLAQSIVELLGNPEKAKEMGEEGFSRLTDCFSIIKNTQMTEQVYSSLL